jgi:hypothetical protein
VPNSRPDEEAIRSIVAAEVTAQMKPFAETLSAVHDWQLSFWSNGSGRVPGFFQMRMKEDDARNLKDADEKAQIKADLSKTTAMAERMDKYIAEQNTLKQHRKERWEKWWPVVSWVGGGIGVAFLGLCTWLGPKLVRGADVIYEDYLKNHPAVSEKLKTVSSEPKSALQSSEKQPQESRIPPLTR